jgi:polysaccharide export outer membrane protein
MGCQTGIGSMRGPEMTYVNGDPATYTGRDAQFSSDSQIVQAANPSMAGIQARPMPSGPGELRGGTETVGKDEHQLAGPMRCGPGELPCGQVLPGGEGPVPVELCKKSLPPYMIEPPDILLIDTVRMIPLPPYRIEPLDVLFVQVTETLPNQPIAGTYVVSPDGTISLGFIYGSVRVAGLTLEEAQIAIRNHLNRVIVRPMVSLALAQARTIQQVRGEHLVRPDGTIGLGTYGCVYVAGLTLAQARCAIEKHLSQFVLNPQISLDVFAYNSKVYYVIADGAGYGEQVLRFPITGNETVLDAISNINGLPAVASKKYIWVARPAPPYHGCYQILPVDWRAITEGGATNTNYQLFPGDRVYIRSDCLISLDYALAKIISPIERLFGITLLGTTTVQTIRNGTTVFGTPVVTTR